jgi:DUF917 family protein
MKTYRDRETGMPVKALLWDGKLATALAEVDGPFDISDADGTLRIAGCDRDEHWEMPVKVGEFLVVTPTGMPVAMEPDGFYRLVWPEVG